MTACLLWASICFNCHSQKSTRNIPLQFWVSICNQGLGISLRDHGKTYSEVPAIWGVFESWSLLRSRFDVSSCCWNNWRMLKANCGKKNVPFGSPCRGAASLVDPQLLHGGIMPHGGKVGMFVAVPCWNIGLGCFGSSSWEFFTPYSFPRSQKTQWLFEEDSSVHYGPNMTRYPLVSTSSPGNCGFAQYLGAFARMPEQPWSCRRSGLSLRHPRCAGEKDRDESGNSRRMKVEWSHGLSWPGGFLDVFGVGCLIPDVWSWMLPRLVTCWKPSDTLEAIDCSGKTARLCHITNDVHIFTGDLYIILCTFLPKQSELPVHMPHQTSRAVWCCTNQFHSLRLVVCLVAMRRFRAASVALLGLQAICWVGPFGSHWSRSATWTEHMFIALFVGRMDGVYRSRSF